MKKVALVLVVLVALLVSVASASANGPLLMADLSNADLTGGGYCSSFNAEQPGGWGGEYGQGAVTAFPGDDDDAGYCTFTWEAGKARRIELRVLDGLADDSFEVYVKNPAGNWVLVYSYMDQYASETWVTHNICSFPAGKGQGSMVDIKIVLTGPHWPNFDTYGQLAVDYIALYEH